jgi:hypothetical protein
MEYRLLRRVMVVGALLSFAIHGCGLRSKRDVQRQLHGSILRNGQPYRMHPQEMLLVSLISVSGEGAPARVSANLDPSDGTFVIVAPASTFPPGEYKVALSSRIAQENKDHFQGVFLEEQTPLKVALSPEVRQEIVIDIEQRTVQVK